MKRFLFAIALMALGAFAALAAAEWILRARLDSIASRAHRDPNLFRYDAALGWRLTPYWKGADVTYDYSVRYAVNGRGYRTEPDIDGLVCLVLGDSFTFGLGVNDDETFTHILGGMPTVVRCVNLAVPGYSTDQEVLQLEQDTANYNLKSVLLVAYLGNDLIDNERPFPIQAADGKPYFVLGKAGLELRNTPVPRDKKEPSFDMRDVLLGNKGSFMSHVEIMRPIAEWLMRNRDLRPSCASSLDLFTALVRRAKDDCAARDAQFELVLMPGRSLIEKPGSLSARYQQFIRREIIQRGVDEDFDVIDLYVPLRKQFQLNHAHLFYPHDGHLTPEGHRAVANILLAQP